MSLRINPTEALADCIMQFEGWVSIGQSNAIPNGSRSWRNRNPGNLRPYNPSQARDLDQYRVFNSLTDGFAALLADLNHKLMIDFAPTDTLLSVMSKYAPVGDNNNPTTYTIFIVHRLTLILGRPINITTTIGEFLYGPSKSQSVQTRT
jgi:hypothetical protein